MKVFLLEVDAKKGAWNGKQRLGDGTELEPYGVFESEAEARKVGLEVAKKNWPRRKPENVLMLITELEVGEAYTSGIGAAEHRHFGKE
jgi:hypothetical protein